AEVVHALPPSYSQSRQRSAALSQTIQPAAYAGCLRARRFRASGRPRQYLGFASSVSLLPTMKYWKGIEELDNSPEFAKNAFAEFPDFLPVKESRAAVLSLYDGGRLQHFMAKGKKADFADIDQAIRTGLASATGKITIVSPTIISPSTKRAIAAFAGSHRNVEHVMYDVNSASGLLQANGGVLPAYDFSRANIIVSIGADFLGTWISPVEYSRQYITNRKVRSDGPTKPTMSRHYQFETALTLTGSNADIRVPVKPSQTPSVVLALYSAIVGGGAPATLDPAISDKVKAAALELQNNRGASLVVAGSNDPAVQALVAAINQTLGNVEGYYLSLRADGRQVHTQGGEKGAPSRALRDDGGRGAAFRYAGQ
nr:hypothetical protein [Tanacetum cinerariifolium]